MKKQLVIATMIATGLLLFAQSATAQNLSDRLRQQKHRIERGVAKGQLTPRETKRLYWEQKEIRQLRWYFLVDGRLTEAEFYVLKRRLDRASGRIIKLKHNQRYAKFPRRCEASDGHYARR